MNHSCTGNIDLIVQYTDKNGHYKEGVNDGPLLDFIETMNKAANNKLYTYQTMNLYSVYGASPSQSNGVLLSDFFDPNTNQIKPPVMAMDWLYLTQSINGSGDNQYGKYKSIYQKGKISDNTAMNMYFSLTDPISHIKQVKPLVQIDSYGGCINSVNKDNQTSVYQRNSLLKWQFQVYWKDPEHAQSCKDWIYHIYSEGFVEYGGKPYEKYNGADTPYQGCYINYPDTDMKYVDDTHLIVDP
ncbi:Aclacinomycin-N/aclacinomycin-A oxidase [Xenorhabdus mauleonii]|uniref:Aclacinomycin-N/aclacinomycin-A oxidase n=2 Tax=Xenorhabdus mauleonii TaxID=351675 RepID=A0A1I3TLZ3_9GAMM|nr:Aclacinomycin-N/aclacinomycin-A oxidase [Xenorhabdus mauleonii]SFJ70557.1 hypothetical protein SAMN05421680_11437 [Xenorhabdus mauleonii]